MPGVDSLLRIMVDNGADELRLASDEPPRMLKRGSPVRLSIPPTSADILRHLLGAIWGDDEDAALLLSPKIERRHTLAGGEAFAVTLHKKGAGTEVFFRRGAAAATISTTPAPAPPPLPPTTAPTPMFAAPQTAAPSSASSSVSASSQSSSASASSSPTAPPPSPPPPLARNLASAQNALNQPFQAVLPHPPTSPAVAIVSAPLQSLLARAIALGASDVHLAAAEPPSLRIDGRLRTLDEHARSHADVAEWLSGVIDEAALAQAHGGRSVDLAFGVAGLGRFRLNLYRASNQLAAAIRVLPPRAPTVSELHLPSTVEDLVAAPHGLIIVCGPTGSGKSATLAALAQTAMRRRPGLVITLEDPVEYLLEATPGSLVRQRQVGRDVVDFATGLRDALREDPDVLLIGEMRDPESISLAITAAETGHLVLTSLHSRSASSAIERMVDSYPPERQQQIRVQLADALRAIVAQRLVPRARGEGRVPAIEILRMSHAVGSLLREGRTEQIPSTMQSGRKEGMLPLERHLADLVKAGQITREHAFAVANETTTLTLYLQD